MSVDLDALEQRAKAATSGPWTAHDPPEEIGHDWAAITSPTGAVVESFWYDGPHLCVSTDDRDFIAAASPDVVLGLIAELRALRIQR